MMWFTRRPAETDASVCLLVRCSDAPALPPDLERLGHGAVMRIASTGNVVPAAEGAPAPIATTLEHAIVFRGVRDIVVCGHTGCAALRALLAPQDLAASEEHRAWFAHAARTRSLVREHYLSLSPEGMFEAAVQEHVLVQLENLLTHRAVADAAREGRLRLHGWLHDATAGRVLAYDPASGQFLPFEAAVPPRRRL